MFKAFGAVFGREPEVQEFDFWLESFRNLRDGDNEITDDLSGFLGSYLAQTPEFKNIVSGSTNVQFLTDLYMRQFERVPDEAGFAFWLAMLESGKTDRTDVVAHFIMSEEYEAQKGAGIDQYLVDLANAATAETTTGQGDVGLDTASDLQAGVVFASEILELIRDGHQINFERVLAPEEMAGEYFQPKSAFEIAQTSQFDLFEWYGVPTGDVDALKAVAPEVFVAPEPVKKAQWVIDKENAKALAFKLNHYSFGEEHVPGYEHIYDIAYVAPLDVVVGYGPPATYDDSVAAAYDPMAIL